MANNKTSDLPPARTGQMWWDRVAGTLWWLSPEGLKIRSRGGKKETSNWENLTHTTPNGLDQCDTIIRLPFPENLVEVPKVGTCWKSVPNDGTSARWRLKNMWGDLEFIHSSNLVGQPCYTLFQLLIGEADGRFIRVSDAPAKPATTLVDDLVEVIKLQEEWLTPISPDEFRTKHKIPVGTQALDWIDAKISAALARAERERGNQ